MSSFRSIVSSPLGHLLETQEDHTPPPSSSIRSTAPPGPPSSTDGGSIEDTFTDHVEIFVDQPVGSMSISPTSRDVALGTRKGLYIVDLVNPWEPARFVPHHSTWEVADVQWALFPHRAQHVASTSNQKAVVYNLDFVSFPATSTASSGAAGVGGGVGGVFHRGAQAAKSPIEHTLHAHTRAVTDINWSSHHPDILATCALDGWVWSWDLRDGYGMKRGGGRKPAWGVSSFGTAATQVKWNRREAHVIASAHDNKVLVWDDRMGATPVSEITAHTAKIYGIDWSRQETDKLITCSLDKSFKSWNVKQPNKCLLSVHTPSPVWRARFLPFGHGALTLPQRSDHALSVWSRDQIEKGPEAKAVKRFDECREGVKEFVWRSRGGSDLSNDDREFQLVTFGADRKLRLFPIEDKLLADVGHVKGAPITIPLPRMQKVPERSYRTYYELETPLEPTPINFPVSPPPPIPRHLGPAAGTSLLSASLASSAPSLLTSSLLSAGFAGNGTMDQQQPQRTPSPSGRSPNDGPRLRPGASVTVIPVPLTKRGVEGNSDRLAWMEGVKYSNNAQDDNSNDAQLEGGEAGGAQSQQPGVASGEASVAQSNAGDVTLTRASSLTRGTMTDAGTAREGISGGATRRESSTVGGTEVVDHRPGSVQTGTAVGAERNKSQYSNLGEELTTIMRRLPRINFERTNVAGRTCTVSLYNGPLFLRATFTFPRGYPATGAPAIDLERTADVALKTRAFFLQTTRKLMARRKERGVPSLENALRFLSGDMSGLEEEENKVKMENDDDDDDEEDEDEEVDPLAAQLSSNFILGDGGMELLPGGQRAMNVPPPRRAGAVFSPTGKLIIFSDVVPSVSRAVAEREREREEAMLVREQEERARKDSANGAPGWKENPFLRVSDAFGVIGGAHEWEAGSYVESDEALQLSTGLSFRATRVPSKPLVTQLPPALTGPTFSSKLRIHDVSHLTLGHPARTVRIGTRSDPAVIAKEAAFEALDRKDAFLAKVWATLAVLFQNVGTTGAREEEDGEASNEPPLTSPIAAGTLNELLGLLVQMRDVQTLGVLACLLQMVIRPYLTSSNTAHPHRSPLSRKRSLMGMPSNDGTGGDYFNRQHSNHHLNTQGTSPFANAIRTPGATQASSARRTLSGGGASLATAGNGSGHSPRPSWANLSVLWSSNRSLRNSSLGGGAGSGPSSPTLSGAQTPTPHAHHQPHGGESAFFLPRGDSQTPPASASVYHPASRSANSSQVHLPALLTSSPKNASPKMGSTVSLPKPSPEGTHHLAPRPSLARVGSSSSPGVPMSSSSLASSVSRGGRAPSRHSPGAHGVTFGMSTVVDNGAKSSTSQSSHWARAGGGTSPLSVRSAGPPSREGGRRVVRVQMEDERPMMPWWLHPETRANLDMLRVGYAELLARWSALGSEGEGEWDEERVAVLKLCDSLAHSSAATTVSQSQEGTPVPGMGAPQAVGKSYAAERVKAGNGYDARVSLEVVSTLDESHEQGAWETARRRACALCHLSVEGLASACTICHHLLHPACSALWFASPPTGGGGAQECPKGCGCSCAASGGKAGVFAVHRERGLGGGGGEEGLVSPSAGSVRSRGARGSLLESLSPKSSLSGGGLGLGAMEGGGRQGARERGVSGGWMSSMGIFAE